MRENQLSGKVGKGSQVIIGAPENMNEAESDPFTVKFVLNYEKQDFKN